MSPRDRLNGQGWMADSAIRRRAACGCSTSCAVGRAENGIKPRLHVGVEILANQEELQKRPAIVTDEEEALRNADSPNNLRLRISLSEKSGTRSGVSLSLEALPGEEEGDGEDNSSGVASFSLPDSD